MNTFFTSFRVYTAERHKMKLFCGLFGAKQLHFMPFGSMSLNIAPLLIVERFTV
jgi:hypothetical protein